MQAIERTEGLPLLKMLVYGPPGCGKTTLAASFNSCKWSAPVLMVDMGGRPETVKQVDPALRVIRLDNIKEINLIYAFFNTGQPDDHPLRKYFNPVLPAGEKFKTLVIDTFTEYQQYEMAYLFGGIEKIGSTEGKHYDLTAVPAAQGFKDWGLIAPNTIIPARDFCNLPVNIIFTLQEFTQLDIKTSTTKRRPRLAGQAIDIVPQYFNMTAVLVWKTSNDKDEVPVVMMLWQLDSEEGYTKQDWIRNCDKRGMINPTAAKLYDLAYKFYDKGENANQTNQTE